MIKKSKKKELKLKKELKRIERFAKLYDKRHWKEHEREKNILRKMDYSDCPF